MKTFALVTLLCIVLIVPVSAQETPTPTITPTATATYTPTPTLTPTPDAGVNWRLSSGQWVEYSYESTAAASVKVPLLLAILISLWGAFFIVLLRARGKQ